MFGFSWLQIFGLLVLVPLLGPIGRFLAIVLIAAVVGVVGVCCIGIDHVVTRFPRRTGARRPK